ncbi:MAG: 23S rRNA (uracil(1939)-C(5))-methyltransferase RlmD, partial [bacterium]
MEIIEQSPKRSQPLCKHYVDCGGCSFQHMDYESQLQEKSATTAETISRLAGIVLDNIYEGIVKSPVRFMYRNKMEFSVLGNIEFSPALHRRCRFDNFVATPYCLLPLPEIMELTKTIYERFTKLKLDLGFLPIYIVALRESFATKEIIVNIVVNKNEIDKMGADYSLIEDKIRGVVFENLSGLRNLASGWVTYGRGSSAEGEPHLLWGNETIVESFCGKRFLVGPASFLQVNPYMAEILYRTISEFVGETKVRRLLDLYSGLGVIGIILSAQVDEVVCVESNEESVKLGQKSALLNGCKNVKFICDDVYRALSGSMARNEHFDIVVVDPPRMGIAKKALEKIIKLQPTKIIYISCNPSTMA